MTEIILLERLLKCLANRRRLAIVQFLKNKQEATVGQIADEISLSLTSTSQHLKSLATMGIVQSEQRSLFVYYRLSATLHPISRAVLDLF